MNEKSGRENQAPLQRKKPLIYLTMFVRLVRQVHLVVHDAAVNRSDNPHWFIHLVDIDIDMRCPSVSD